MTVGVTYPPIIAGDFSANVTGWEPLGGATFAWDSGQRAGLWTVGGAGHGYRLTNPVTVEAGVTYERLIRIKRGTYSGAQINVFMDDLQMAPAQLTLTDDYDLHRFVYTQAVGDTAARVSCTRAGSVVGTLFVDSDITRRIA